VARSSLIVTAGLLEGITTEDAEDAEESNSEFVRFSLIPNSKFQILNSEFLSSRPPCPPWWDCHFSDTLLDKPVVIRIDLVASKMVP
jgi:hypothetical protein